MFSVCKRGKNVSVAAAAFEDMEVLEVSTLVIIVLSSQTPSIFSSTTALPFMTES